jgi:short-subunit dehydrogenase
LCSAFCRLTLIPATDNCRIMKKGVCIIVGFGPGMGLALARAFGREGLALALLSREPARHGALLAPLEQDGLTVRTWAADAGNEGVLTAAITASEQELGGTEVLIYNALVPTFAPPTALTAEQLVADFRVNVVGALVSTLGVLPGMRARARGTVLFTGGAWAFQPWSGAASPGIGKAGLRNLAQSLAQELAGSGVHIGTVTIGGQVQTGTHFDPDKIAQAYVTLYRQPPGQFEMEFIYD